MSRGLEKVLASTGAGRSPVRRKGWFRLCPAGRRPGADTGMRSSTGAGSVPKARQMAEARPRAKVTSGSRSSRSFSSASSFCGDTFMALASSIGSTPADSRSWRSIWPADAGGTAPSAGASGAGCVPGAATVLS